MLETDELVIKHVVDHMFSVTCLIHLANLTTVAKEVIPWKMQESVYKLYETGQFFCDFAGIDNEKAVIGISPSPTQVFIKWESTQNPVGDVFVTEGRIINLF